MSLTGSLLLFGLATSGAFAGANGAKAMADGALRVGPSGIHCVKEPCPRRSIERVDASGKRLGPRALFNGVEGPAIVGAEPDRTLVESAWRDYRCLMVEGRLEAGALHVKRILGDCRASHGAAGKKRASDSGAKEKSRNCRRIVWRLRNAANFSGGSMSLVRVPVCVR